MFFFTPTRIVDISGLGVSRHNKCYTKRLHMSHVCVSGQSTGFSKGGFGACTQSVGDFCYDF